MSQRFIALTPADASAPTGLIRLTMDQGGLTLESFDRTKKAWIDAPQAIDFLNGDDEDGQEISADAAAQLLKSWGATAS